MLRFHILNLITAAGVSSLLALLPYAAGAGGYLPNWAVITVFVYVLDWLLYHERTPG
jgi:hypothetical protein